MQARHEVADVLHVLGTGIEKLGLNAWQLRALNALKHCRTAMLGGHVDACDGCGTISISYNSCRNRHCPKCQGHKKQAWIEARSQELLPVPYFHVVFTLPQELNTLAMCQPKQVYDALFAASWQTLETFGKKVGAQMGMVAVLHTWGQNLSLHPHLHCIVPGGGVNRAGLWQNIRSDGKYLFPVKALSKVFRAKYMAALGGVGIDRQLRDSLFKKNWVVYAKRPFGNAHAVLEYLGRYTHKVAISNHRLKDICADTVTFDYKDYKAKGEKKTMTLGTGEFVRRFALHVLPKRFMKMRHYGFLSSTWKRQKLKNLQASLGMKSKPGDEGKPSNFRKCPCCKVGNLLTIEVFGKRGPPAWYMGASQNQIPRKD